MKKDLLAFLLSLSGCLLMMVGVFLLSEALTPTPIIAQEDAEYAGVRSCSGCHSNIARLHTESNHARTLQNVGRDKSAILADFSDEASIPQILFPEETEPRPLTPDDIAYTLGAGRYVQRYLYQVSRNNYQVFPVQWNTITNDWETVLLDGTDDWQSDAYNFGQNCAYCHTSGFDTERFRWSDDGVQCETCHSNGSEHARLADRAGRNPSERELARLKAAINPASDAQTCGQCHSQGQAPSGHPFPIGYIAGGDLLSETTFALVSTDDARFWWGTGNAKHTNMQYNEWATSGHADAVSCASCHRPHTETTYPHLLIQTPYALCASCHNNTPLDDELAIKAPPNWEMYEGLQVVEEVIGIPSAHFSARTNAPDCLTCHMHTVPVDGFDRASHTFAVILPELALDVPEITDGCTACHGEQTSSQNLQLLINDIQATIQTRITNARAFVTDDTPQWVVIALDFVTEDGSWGVHNYAYSDALLDAVEEALGIVTVNR